MLIANSNLVPKWATWEKFNELDRAGLMMYGQMTAGSWIYIGTQGIVQGTYETFAEMGRQHYGGDLTGKWILTAGLGGMGGAQPLAAVMAGAHCIAIEVQESSIEKRLATRYLDHRATSIDEALEIIAKAKRADQRRPARQRRRNPPRNGRARHPPRRASPTRPAPTIPPTAIARPAGASPNGLEMRETRSRRRRRRPRAISMARHVEAMLAFQEMGVPDLRLWQQHPPGSARRRRRQRVRLPRLRPRLCPALVLPRHRPVPLGRAVAAIPRTSTSTDQRVKELIPDDPHLHRWLDMARERIAFQGLPARICWVGLGQRHRLGLAFNEMVRNGEVSARRSSSAATISTAAASPRPTARPRR